MCIELRKCLQKITKTNEIWNRASNDERFLEHIITGDETCVHYSIPYNNKRESMICKYLESRVPKKFKQAISLKKSDDYCFLGRTGNVTD